MSATAASIRLVRPGTIVEWLGQWRRQDHGLDAEPRRYRIDAVAQQPGQTFAIPDRLCRTDPHRLQRVVDAVEQQVELASPQPPFLQRRTEFVDKLGNVARHGLGCRNRFRERLDDAE